MFSLLNRETGEVRSRVVPDVTAKTLRAAINEEVDAAASVLHTDNAMAYTCIGWSFQGHQTVNHGMSEYVRGSVTTNHLEGFFSQLKRSVDGTFHHVSKEHLDRYLDEFDYRYSTRKLTDAQRVARLMGQVHGRRLCLPAADERPLMWRCHPRLGADVQCSLHGRRRGQRGEGRRAGTVATCLCRPTHRQAAVAASGRRGVAGRECETLDC